MAHPGSLAERPIQARGCGPRGGTVGTRDEFEQKYELLRLRIADRRAEFTKWQARFAECKAWFAEREAGEARFDEEFAGEIAELRALAHRLDQGKDSAEEPAASPRDETPQPQHLEQYEAEAPVASPEQVTPPPQRHWLPRPSLNNLWLLALVAYVPNSLLYFFDGSNPSAFPKNLAVAGWFVAVGLWSLAWWLLGKLGKRTAPQAQRRELTWQTLSVFMAFEFLADRLLNVFGRPNPWTPSKIVGVTVYSVCVVLGLVGLWLRGREKRAATASGS